MLLAYRALSSYCRGPVLLALNLPSLLIAFPIFGSLRLLPWRSCLFLPMCVLPHDILLCVLCILLDNSCLYYIILSNAFQVILLYNVFYISVSNDVRFYGQLRTIGTTSIQIGKIISRQAMKIACFGIIAGLLGSFALSIFFSPLHF